MEILLIALLTVLNGIFAMSEMALASSRKPRLSALAEAGDTGAAAALRLMEQPTRFLSTVQVGITSIGVLNGIVGEAAFSESLTHWLQGVGVSGRWSHYLATGLVVAAITYVTIIFGELVPKRVGQLYPEGVSRWLAPPMGFLSRAAGPFVKLLSGSTIAVLKMLPIDLARARGMTEEEIAHSLEEGVDAGVIEEHEHQMVQNVFHLDDRPLTSMMVPRSDIQWLDAGLSVGECLREVGRDGAHSWYPVCRGSLEDVVGVVSVSKLLALGMNDPTRLESIATPALFVPETLSGMELLEQFRERTGRMVFVVDEYGVVQGLMTPHDLLEAITGELQPVAAADAWATQRADGAWELDGTMPISELKARLDIRELPQEDRGRYNTVAGLLMSVSGHLPGAGEHIECGDWVFDVVSLDGKRIDRVLARPQVAAGGTEAARAS
jgi:putative hemolysin